MNTDRIKKIQLETAYPESVSVQQALLKVWNETEQEQLRVGAVISWVAVEEKMPESGQCVLLYSPKSGVGEGAWISAKGHFEQWRWNAILTNVSHWMPMPEPPCL